MWSNPSLVFTTQCYTGELPSAGNYFEISFTKKYKKGIRTSICYKKGKAEEERSEGRKKS
jgi:hypothetical protein